ncbi:MAG TPA: ABC transporter substrate-binding protein [Solirubrobacteraceae bacterium]|nr:ABC transporter substrate-binding protein [Solirubrobacteraceae bacterium]
MRIVSLVPHATELLFALGLADAVVGVTHECDHPAAATQLPRVTRDVLPAGLSSAAIDAAVRERIRAGEAIYVLDEELLRELEPDLIVTQELCPVCAVSHDDVLAVAERMRPCPRVIALDPQTFGETMADVRTIARATGAQAAALDLVARQRARVDAVRSAVAGAAPVPVVALEWLDPVFAAGHWTPQLIELAGGVDVLGRPGEPSLQVPWAAVAAARPEVVVVMPCGYGAARALEEAELHAAELRALGARRVVAVDAGATFSRPGPRLVDGLETLAAVLHPGRGIDAPGPALEVEL